MKDLPHKAHYRPGEVADYFDIPIKTLYQRIHEGIVAAIKPVGGRSIRISREEVERMKNLVVE